MCRTSRRQRLFSWSIRLISFAALLMPHVGRSQELAEPFAAAKSPTRTKAPGEPVRLAMLTVAVHTPVLVRAYDQFRQRHGEGKLELDLWIEQEWAESPRPLDFGSYDMVLALRCSIPGLDKALADAAAGGAWVVSQSSLEHREGAVLIDDLPDLAPYYRQRGVANMVGLYEKICERFGVPGVVAPPPANAADQGIYHPDADTVFANAAAYWKWYETQPCFKPSAPKIGVFV